MGQRVALGRLALGIPSTLECQVWPGPFPGWGPGLQRSPAGCWADSPLGEPAGVWPLRLRLLAWQAGAGRREG